MQFSEKRPFPGSCFKIVNFEIDFPECKIEDRNSYIVQISVNDGRKLLTEFLDPPGFAAV